MASIRPSMLPVILRTNALIYSLFASVKARLDGGKRFVECQRARETITGGSQIDFIDEIL